MCPVYDGLAVKRPNEEIEYTSEQIQELLLCSDDVIYFSKYVKIKTRKGKKAFEPYQFQRDLIGLINNNRYVITKIARQSGKTTVVGTWLLHYAIFNKDKFIGIVSNKEPSAKKILRELKKIYEELPIWLKPGVIEWNKTSVEFDNGSRIEISSTNPNAFTGNTIDCLFCDEFAKVPKNIADDFWASLYPTLSSLDDSRIIVVSTPAGMFNMFHELYVAAENGRNDFVYYSADWTCVPWHDEAWAKKERKNIGSEQRWNQEFMVKFIGSSATVIESKILETMFNVRKEPIKTDLNERLKIYAEPIKGNTYILGVDPSKGTEGDNAAIQVLLIKSLVPIQAEQVAVFKDNKTDVYQLADIVHRLSNYYNGAKIMIENNSTGYATVKRLWWELENMNVFNNKAGDIGIYATKNTKTRAVLMMKKLIEDMSLIINDHDTIKELGAFIERGGRFYGKDMLDDLVSGLYWGAYAFEVGDQIFDDTPQINKQDNEVWGILSDFSVDPNENFDWMRAEERKGLVYNEQ